METRLKANGKVKPKSSACTLCSEISTMSELIAEQLVQIQYVIGNLEPTVPGVLNECLEEQSVYCGNCEILLKEAARLHAILETLTFQLNSALVSIKAKVIERSLKVQEDRKRAQSSVTSEVEGFTGNEYFVIKDDAESDEEFYVPSDSEVSDADDTFSVPSTGESSSSDENDDEIYEPPCKTRRVITKTSSIDYNKSKQGIETPKTNTALIFTNPERPWRSKNRRSTADAEEGRPESRKSLRSCFFCSWCSKYFRSNRNKLLHYESVHFKGAAEDVEGGCLLYSRICGKSSMTPGDLSRHNETFHNSSIRFLCSSCDKKFTSKDLLKAHKSIHSFLESFPCSLCVSSVPVTFKTPIELDNHILRIHAHTIRFSRDIHSNQVDPECVNSIHLRGKHSTCCRWCGSRIRRLHVLRAHERKRHPERFTFKCKNQDCRSSFAEESHLLTCQETHRDSPGPFKCFVCQITCPSASELKEHLAAKHTAGGLKCDECPKVPLSFTRRFLNMTALKEHKVVKHRTEWTYKCPICQNEFKTHSLLKDHLRSVHNNPNDPTISKVYECIDCEMKFKKPGALKSHRQVKHQAQINREQDEARTCAQCNRKHKNSKRRAECCRIICKVCGRQFDRPLRLEIHTTKKHPNVNILS